MATINFNDAIFAQEALQGFTASLTPISIFSKSYSQHAAKKGANIYVPRVDHVSVTTFSYSNNSGVPYEESGGTVNTVTVTLDKHHIVTVDMTDQQLSTAFDAAVFGQQQGRALGKRVLQSIWASFTTVNFGLPVVSANIADYTPRSILRGRGAMLKRDVPDGQLSVVTNEEVNHYLLGDENLRIAAQYGGGEAIREGRIPKLWNCDVYRSNIIPLNGSVSLVGFISHPNAIALAIRYLEPQAPGEYQSVMRMTDPESGITMGYRRHYNPSEGKMFANFECLFGWNFGLTLGLGLMVRND